MRRALSPKDLAAAIGVSESSLKRWADAGKITVARTEGGHRRIPMAEAVRFIRESGAQVVRPEVLGLAEVAAAANEGEAGDDALYDQLIAGHAAEVRGLVLGMYLRGAPLAEIFDGPIREAMLRIGELWQHDPSGVFIEHRATDVCLQAIAQLRALVEAPVDGPIAVGGAPASDPYLLPSQLVSTLLASEGMRPVNLGADTPAASLREAMERLQPRLVWVSVSAPPRPSLGRDLEELAAACLATGALLVIGGRESWALPPPPPGATRIGSMVELASFVRRMRARVKPV